jgi:hypothetical protein
MINHEFAGIQHTINAICHTRRMLAIHLGWRSAIVEANVEAAASQCADLKIAIINLNIN